jgi:hypothetical protein
MPIMKRIFAKRRSKQSYQSEDSSDKLPKPARKKKPSKKDREDASASKIEEVGGEKEDGKLLSYSPKTILAPKQAAKKKFPAVVPAISSEPESKSKNNEIDSANDSTKNGGNLAKSIGDDESVASSTKSASDGAEIKVNANGGATPSPVKDKVKEVVVPQSSAEDRHATISNAYDSIPLLEQTKLPRGGISVETKAVGRVQVRITSYMCKHISSSLSCFQIVAFPSHLTIAMVTNSDGCQLFLSLSVWYSTRNHQR